MSRTLQDHGRLGGARLLPRPDTPLSPATVTMNLNDATKTALHNVLAGHLFIDASN